MPQTPGKPIQVPYRTPELIARLDYVTHFPTPDPIWVGGAGRSAPAGAAPGLGENLKPAIDLQQNKGRT